MGGRRRERREEIREEITGDVHPPYQSGKLQHRDSWRSTIVRNSSRGK